MRGKRPYHDKQSRSRIRILNSSLMNFGRVMKNCRLFQNRSLRMESGSPPPFMKRWVPCGQFPTFRYIRVLVSKMVPPQRQLGFCFKMMTFVLLSVWCTFPGTSPRNLLRKSIRAVDQEPGLVVLEGGLCDHGSVQCCLQNPATFSRVVEQNHIAVSMAFFKSRLVRVWERFYAVLDGFAYLTNVDFFNNVELPFE